MTIKQIKKEIEKGNIPEAEVEKTLLLISAAESLSKEMHSKLEGLALNKKLREFLESEKFASTIYNIIVETRAAKVEALMKLRTKELKLLKNRKATTEEQLIICEKLREGIRSLLQKAKELDYDTILFQGLFVSYVDTLTAGYNV